MPSVPRRLQAFLRGLALRCPRCGGARLFRGFFRMHDACSACGLTFRREPGFYLGSIYINYGITVIVTGLLYAALALGLGLSQRTTLGACLAVAVLFPLAFFRHARSFLLAMDSAVNRHQSQPLAAGATPDSAGLSRAQLKELSQDDASAGCMMGIALVLIVLFGLLMAGVTIYFTMITPTASLPSV
ncbi:DUF983 domain-containing protein [bacterium]|nr:DUF983 domain-containing protein [bacterium]